MDMHTPASSEHTQALKALDNPVLVLWSEHSPAVATDSAATGLGTAFPEQHHSQQHDLQEVLEEAARHYPERALLLLRCDLQQPADLLSRLHWWQQHAGAEALTCCSNSAAAFNPFGFDDQLAEPPADAALDALVANSSQQPLLQATQWPQHLLWLRARSVRLLLRMAQTWSQRSPLACGVRLLVADDMFSRDPQRSLFTARPDYAWDLPPAEAIEYRSQILQGLLRQQQFALPRLPQTAEQVTLHISHSWGGGVQHWVDNYCQAAQEHPQLVLKSQGFWKRKTYGSRFSLHQGGTDGAELQSWHLAPAIASTSIRHPQYQQMLDEICNRYRVQRIVISSLIGHSLDALRRSIPTIVVIHDYYPAWPLLSQPPGQQAASQTLQQQLQKLQQQPHNLSGDDLLMFTDRDARGWHTLTLAWQQLLQQAHVAMVAPSHAARQQLLQLVPALAESKQLQLQVIAHGFAGWEQHAASANPPDIQTATDSADNAAGGRLRLVLVGRLVSGKGLELLHRSWPLLREHVQLTLLGCGRSGRSMLGQAQVDVISDYAWQQLPDIIAQLRPDAALLLSTVSETYSYTLTEMQALKLPVIATRRGSFSERVSDGVNGLLIEPEPQALHQAIVQLRQQPQLLAQLRRGACETVVVPMSVMLARYNTLLQALRQRCSEAALNPPRQLRTPDLLTAQALQLSRDNLWQRGELEQQQLQLGKQAAELSRRADAMQRQRRALDQSQQRLQQLREKLQLAEDKLPQLRAQLQQQMQQLKSSLQQQMQQQQTSHAQQVDLLQRYIADLEQQRDQVLASKSWRFTMPLRVVSRLFANFRRQRVWNPLRWPTLLRSFIKLSLSNGLLATLRQLQGPTSQPDTQAVAREDHNEASSSAMTPLRWERAAADAVDITAVLLVLPADADADNDMADCLLAMLHRLQDALRGQASEVHVISGDAGPLLADCQGLIEHTDLAAALAALQPAAERCRQLLLINNLLQLRADTIPQLLQAAVQGHDMVCARCIEHASEVATPLHPQQAFAHQVFAFRADLLLLTAPCLPAFMQYCSAQSGLPNGIDAALLALAQSRYQRSGKAVWQQSLSLYQHHAESRPRLQLRDCGAAHPAGCMLVVDVWVPMADKDSGSLRMVNLLRLLVELGWRVLFVPGNLGHAGHYTEQLQQLGVEVWYQPWFGNWKTFLQQHGGEFDVVMLSRLSIASELLRRVRRYCPQASIIYDTVDLHYLREQRQAELQNSLALRRLAAQTRHQELKLMQQADLTLVVSAAEQALLQQQSAAARVRVLSNIHAVPGCQNGFEQRSGVLFVGGFQHPPNIDAAVWLAEQIWPLVLARLPQAQLHLIGSNATEKIQALASDSIIVHGFVPELEPWLDQVRCSVAPLRYGAGVKGKINSSMSRGVPVVATSVAAEGMFLTDRHDVLLADHSEQFAAAICSLHEDPSLWQTLSTNAVANVQEHFSLARAKSDLQQILQELRASKRDGEDKLPASP